MNEYRFAVVLVFLTSIGFMMTMFVVASYGSYQQDNFSNQIDVCQHLGNVTTVDSVLHGQTVRYGIGNLNNGDDQFNFWLQAMQDHDITVVYSVPRSSWGLTYRGAALYFTYKGVIYLYQ